MTWTFFSKPFGCVLMASAIISVSATSSANAAEPVPFFDAIEQGIIKAQIFPANAKGGNVLIQNLADAEIIVELPDAFAAIPVFKNLPPNQLGPKVALGQFGLGGPQAGGQGLGMGVGMGQQQGGGGGVGNQSVGGNMGGNNMLGGGQNGGGQMGMFRIGPQKKRKLTATTACLEHGKPDPNPRVAYKIVPIDQVSSNTQLHELCAKLGSKSMPQNTGQAVAWHLANGLSWKEIAKVNRITSRFHPDVRMFTKAEIKAAEKWVKESTENKADAVVDHYAISDR